MVDSKKVEKNDSDECMIVMRVPYLDDKGVTMEKLHGPMPRSEWDEYAKKNGL